MTQEVTHIISNANEFNMESTYSETTRQDQSSSCLSEAEKEVTMMHFQAAMAADIERAEREERDLSGRDSERESQPGLNSKNDQTDDLLFALREIFTSFKNSQGNQGIRITRR